MLAHSNDHVALLHGTRTAARGQIADMASIPLIFMGGWLSSHADSQQSQSLAPVGFLQFQRTHELEAKRFGLELSSRAGVRRRRIPTLYRAHTLGGFKNIAVACT
ncbi:MAG: hypothetical protein H7Y20_02790 [Bryobacteraceae bacterium]|nr:hypothetical protein [Bryobacteraceae bacterium]